MGKHDAFPRYECLEKPFDPQDEWEPIPCPQALKPPKSILPDVPRTNEEYTPENPEYTPSQAAE